MISTTTSFPKNVHHLNGQTLRTSRYPFLKKGSPKGFHVMEKPLMKVLTKDLLLYKYSQLNQSINLSIYWTPFIYLSIGHHLPIYWTPFTYLSIYWTRFTCKYLIMQFVSGTTLSPRGSKFSSFKEYTNLSDPVR